MPIDNHHQRHRDKPIFVILSAEERAMLLWLARHDQQSISVTIRQLIRTAYRVGRVTAEQSASEVAA